MVRPIEFNGMRKEREDISDRVTHLIKNIGDEEALETLFKIAHQGVLHGNTTNVVGQRRVICFSESPTGEFIKEKYFFTSYGVSIRKDWFFEEGGRPVIYQPREEHKLIAPSLHWKLVTYNPLEDNWADWTWQREWRIEAHELELPEDSIFIVPNNEAKNKLRELFEEEENYRALCEQLCLGIYPYGPRVFPYEIMALE